MAHLPGPRPGQSPVAADRKWDYVAFQPTDTAPEALEDITVGIETILIVVGVIAIVAIVVGAKKSKRRVEHHVKPTEPVERRPDRGAH